MYYNSYYAMANGHPKSNKRILGYILYSEVPLQALFVVFSWGSLYSCMIWILTTNHQEWSTDKPFFHLFVLFCFCFFIILCLFAIISFCSSLLSCPAHVLASGVQYLVLLHSYWVCTACVYKKCNNQMKTIKNTSPQFQSG